MDHDFQSDNAVPKAGTFIKRLFVVMLVTILLMTGACYAAMHILLCGPSVYAGKVAAVSLARQPVVCKLLELYLTPEEIAALQYVELEDTQSGGEEEIYFSVYPEVK